MSKEKHRQQGEMQQMVDDHYKSRTNRKSGITRQEWDKVQQTISLSEKQSNLYKGIRNNTLTICQGPAGTSKTFVACYAAIGLLADKKIEKIILTKPIQESGENLGFLPGTIQEKTDPYMQSYFSNFKKILGGQTFEFLKSTGEIVVEPLAYMRGTAQPLDAQIMTPNGYVTMGSIEVGDYVIGSNGQKTKVLGVYPQGEKDIYKITFSDGSSTECCGEHLWEVQSLNQKRSNKWLVKNTLELKEDLYDKWGRKKYRIPIISEPVNFERCEVPIDPYLLGLLLGDGCLHENSSVSFSTADDEIIDRVNEIINSRGLTARKRSEYDYGLVSKNNKNYLKNELRNLELLGTKSVNKFIPDIYKFNSIDIRIELLRGLLDTDGWIGFHRSKKNRIQYYSSSEKLINDVRFIVESLGGVANINFKDVEGSDYIKGRLIHRKNHHALDIKLPKNFNPFKLNRKSQRYTTTSKPIRQIVSIEKVSVKEAKCIKVDAQDSLYLTNNSIVTHNTYDDAIMLLDEAQNCTMHQLMLWATRLGKNSKAMMMGDVSQYDIKKKDSKFLDFISIITGEYNFKEDDVADITEYKTMLGDVYYHKFATEDIVRNKFLIDLVNRYEKYKFQNGI
jgi:phosphate starvation-inducible PhoH-like protein